MRSDLVTHDPDALFNIIAKRLRDQAVIEANDAERRQKSKRRDARSMGAAGTKPQGSAADEHDSREYQGCWCESRAESSVRQQRVFRMWQARTQTMGLSPKLAGKAGKGVRGQSHGQTPTQQQQFTNGPAQHTWSKTTGMVPASATPRANGYQIASKAVVRKTTPAAPEASTQNVYIRVPREKMAPVDNGLTRQCSTRFP